MIRLAVALGLGFLLGLYYAARPIERLSGDLGQCRRELSRCAMEHRTAPIPPADFSRKLH